jgi:hypothetical protein
MAHQITSEGGANLSPTAPGQTVAEGGASLAPTAPGQIGAEGGVSLSPTIPAVIAGEGGVTLSPDSPPDLTPDYDRSSTLKVAGLNYAGDPLGDFYIFREDAVEAWSNGDATRHLRIYQYGTEWIIEYRADGETLGTISDNTGAVSPWLASAWSIQSGDIGGDPVVTQVSVSDPGQITPGSSY